MAGGTCVAHAAQCHESGDVENAREGIVTLLTVDMLDLQEGA